MDSRGKSENWTLAGKTSNAPNLIPQRFKVEITQCHLARGAVVHGVFWLSVTPSDFGHCDEFEHPVFSLDPWQEHATSSPPMTDIELAEKVLKDFFILKGDYATVPARTWPEMEQRLSVAHALINSLVMENNGLAEKWLDRLSDIEEKLDDVRTEIAQEANRNR